MVSSDTIISINPDKLVITPVASVREGMNVVTHNREIKNVERVLKSDYSQELYFIRVWGYTKSILVTAETQFLVYPNLRLVQGQVSRSPSPERTFDIAWKRTVLLDKNDYLQVPTPYYRKSLLHTVDFLPESFGRGGYLPHDTGLFCRVKSINKVPYDGLIYSFVVSQDNSFIANGFTVRT